MRTLSYRQAINEAIQQEMERDPRVFIYGLDVPDHKRIFGSTVGLLEKFGSERCFGTPLSEDAMTGFGLGAALNGLRPIHVHIRVDFLLLALNQLFNMISCYRYMTGGKCAIPLVIRAVIGRGWGQSFQHSKSLQSIFAHIPGLKVIMPTSPQDAKGLMIAAIRDNNPVIVLEHRWLYDVEGDVEETPFETPIGTARILRTGKDLTVIATSWMNIEAQKAAQILEKHHVDLEIIDPRSISPLDMETLVTSVTKTGHCIIADYDWLNCGFSSEISARLMETCFHSLKSPVKRIGFAPTPCPGTRPLENLFYPNAITIIREVEKKLSLSKIDLSQETFYSYENKFKGPF
ncbi:MAG: alpha-ketoacid dehydrogenase subunit beta [Deltaproteobacteria bacterium]|nr:alpha-ketoacid dehydrogenase subunit beta [Deltaproteobacteria bacterium]